MAGVDRFSGAPLDGFGHVQQSIGVIFTTPIGARLMRRWFGSDVPRLLGDNLGATTVLRFATAVIVAIELWEPRFKVTAVDVPATNTSDRMRAGNLAMSIRGQYLPRALQGDFTPAPGERTISFGPGGAAL